MYLHTLRTILNTYIYRMNALKRSKELKVAIRLPVNHLLWHWAVGAKFLPILSHLSVGLSLCKIIVTARVFKTAYAILYHCDWIVHDVTLSKSVVPWDVSEMGVARISFSSLFWFCMKHLNMSFMIRNEMHAHMKTQNDMLKV